MLLWRGRAAFNQDFGKAANAQGDVMVWVP